MEQQQRPRVARAMAIGMNLHEATACMYSFADEFGVRYGAAPLNCKATSQRVSIALASLLLGRR
jgi:hypothetical protein